MKKKRRSPTYMPRSSDDKPIDEGFGTTVPRGWANTKTRTNRTHQTRHARTCKYNRAIPTEEHVTSGGCKLPKRETFFFLVLRRFELEPPKRFKFLWLGPRHTYKNEGLSGVYFRQRQRRRQVSEEDDKMFPVLPPPSPLGGLDLTYPSSSRLSTKTHGIDCSRNC